MLLSVDIQLDDYAGAIFSRYALQFHTMVLHVLDTQVHMETLQFHTIVLQVL